MTEPRLIYVAHKYSEDAVYKVQRNIDRARIYAQEIAILGALPLAPGQLAGHFEGIQDYDWWSVAYMHLMRRCDAVFMVPRYEQSHGAMLELEEALRLGMPVFYHLSELKQWLNQ